MREELISLGFMLIFLGMIVLMLGFILSLPRGERGETRVEGGGVILIGPFPIVFGSSSESAKAVVLLTIALVVVVYLLFYRRF